MTHLTSSKIDRLTKEGIDLLGKHLIIRNLHLPKVDQAAAVTLNTRGHIQFAISEIEIYPYLIGGSRYERRFQNEDRSDGGVFTFQAYGAPLVAQILDGKSASIAVIKRLMDANGRDHCWADVLQTLGASRAQFNEFIERVDNVQANDESSPLQFQETEQNPLDYLENIPDKKAKNLSSVLQIKKISRKELMQILQSLRSDSVNPRSKVF